MTMISFVLGQDSKADSRYNKENTKLLKSIYVIVIPRYEYDIVVITAKPSMSLNNYDIIEVHVV